MSFGPQSNDPVVCHCLGVSQSEIRAAGDFAGCRTVADIKSATEAGSGCNSCHRRILALLQHSSRPQEATAVDG